MPAQFTKHFVQDLQQDIKIRQCGTIVFNADNESNIISVDLYNGTEPYSGGGTVAGAVICPDGATVALDNGTLTGNVASVTLTADCFAIPGQIGVGVQVISGSVRTTVLKAIYNVELLSTDNMVDPDSRITASVTQLVADIEAATAEIPASDMASLMSGIAPTFSASTNYAAGAYVYYSGTLYRFTAYHAAGSWTGTDATQVALGNDLGNQVSDIKSAVTQIDGTLYGENKFNSSVIGSGNNTAIANKNNGSYTVGTSDFGTTIFGEQVTLTPGKYYLYGVSYGKSFVSTTQNTQGIIVQNTSADPLEFTITEDTACYLGYRNEVKPSASFVITPYVRETGMVHDVERIDDEVSKLISTEKVTHITDPHKLFWRNGNFNQDGTITSTSQTRIWTSCRVKAGSRVIAASANQVQMQFGYKVDDSQTGLDYYDEYRYRDVTVEQDCTIYIGILYTNPVYLPNDKIVEAITIDLNVIDYVNKFSKNRVFGNPLPIHYEGQHTDATGWNLDTADPDDIHDAFDALVSASDGWLTKKDLGVAYSTYHMYEYDTVPVGLHSYGGINLPKIAIICCQHGNEKMSAYAMHYLMYDLIHNPSKNPVLSYLRSNCAISFIPIANPWGFINRSRLNENGVNLNRNWATYNWDEYSDETSGSGGINYKGESQASEDQTKLMVTFLRNNYDAVYAIDLHTNGENTIGWYEISTAIINADADTTSENYKIQSSYFVPSKLNTNYIKGWMDENYGTHLGNVFYGAVNFPEQDRPTAAQWIRESNNMVGITFEILAGNSDDYLGDTLKRYAPATIKAAAEILGDYLVAMLANCKEQ